MGDPDFGLSRIAVLENNLRGPHLIAAEAKKRRRAATANYRATGVWGDRLTVRLFGWMFTSPTADLGDCTGEPA
jgi:hypothetical protein